MSKISDEARNNGDFNAAVQGLVKIGTMRKQVKKNIYDAASQYWATQPPQDSDDADIDTAVPKCLLETEQRLMAPLEKEQYQVFLLIQRVQSSLRSSLLEGVIEQHSEFLIEPWTAEKSETLVRIKALVRIMLEIDNMDEGDFIKRFKTDYTRIYTEEFKVEKSYLTPLIRLDGSYEANLNDNRVRSVEASVADTGADMANNDCDITMQVLAGFMAVVGVAAVAIAFLVLNASTFGTVGVVVACVGVASLLAGCGLFTASYAGSESHEYGDEPVLVA